MAGVLLIVYSGVKIFFCRFDRTVTSGGCQQMTLMKIKDDILSRLSIVELIGQTVALKKRANRHLGLCPFHAEKSPSFTVFDDHYYCFGCHASGDIIDFVRKQHGSGFIETLHMLGEKCGVDTSSLKFGAKRGLNQKQLAEVMAVAQEFFHQQILSDNEGAAKAVAYLAERGFELADIKRYRIGYALNEKCALREYLKGKGVSLDTAVNLALLNRKGKNFWDFFIDRIMIPIHNERGQVVAFAGRVLDSQQLKYLNSRETDLFHKSRTLFGLWHSAKAIADKKTVLVVEGYFDWLALQKVGINNCVSCMGTTLKDSQLKLIKRYLNKVILIFDGDGAGVDAALAALKLVFAFPEIDITVCQLPDKHDPDSYLREYGPEKFAELLTQTQGVIDFTITTRLDRATTRDMPTVIRKEIVPLLRKITDSVQLGILIDRVSHSSGLNHRSIEQLLKQQRSPRHQTINRQTTDQQPEIMRPIKSWDRELFGHVYYAQPQELDIETLDKFEREELRFHPYLQVLWEEMVANLREGDCNYQLNLLSGLNDPKNYPAEILNLLAKLANDQLAYRVKDRNEKIATLVKCHKNNLLEEKINMLQRELNRSQNEDSIELLKEITALRGLARPTDKPRPIRTT